jgi:hypothetical protein
MAARLPSRHDRATDAGMPAPHPKGTTTMTRPDPNVTLARYHVRHVVPQAGCPLCMRSRVPADTLPRWAKPRSRAAR